jgi:hypothetical protein
LSVLVGEVSARHGSSNAHAAADVMIKGRYAVLFWASLIAGAIVPGFLLLTGGIGVPLASGLALAGLLAYEHAFVMSAQSVPVS